MPEVETDSAGRIRIVEHHSPILDVLRAFPITAKLETDLFQRLLGVTVRRDEIVASGLYCATFHCGDPLQPAPRDGGSAAELQPKAAWSGAADRKVDLPRL
jgi:hypothetical protein